MRELARRIREVLYLGKPTRAEKRRAIEALAMLEVYALDAEVRAEQGRAAADGLLWLNNNRHNRDLPQFWEFFDAAVEDAQGVHDGAVS